MTDDIFFRAEINPLQYIEGEENIQNPHSNLSSYESFIKFLCGRELKSDIKSILKRYSEINKEYLFVAPAEKNILNKLIWPLKYAKGSYIIGNYLGTISLCGMVAEMVAILLFEINEFKINDKKITIDQQKKLFGSTFEGLGQERRINILRTYGVIDDEFKNYFLIIKSIRRRYLHFWSQEYETISSDSLKVFLSAVKIVVKLIGQDVRKGKLLLNPAFQKYLDNLGILKKLDGD